MLETKEPDTETDIETAIRLYGDAIGFWRDVQEASRVARIAWEAACKAVADTMIADEKDRVS